MRIITIKVVLVMSCSFNNSRISAEGANVMISLDLYLVARHSTFKKLKLN